MDFTLSEKDELLHLSQAQNHTFKKVFSFEKRITPKEGVSGIKTLC